MYDWIEAHRGSAIVRDTRTREESAAADMDLDAFVVHASRNRWWQANHGPLGA